MLFNENRRGKLYVTARDLAGRLGEFFPGIGSVVFDDVLAASGVKKRQFWNHLAALAPTFLTTRSGARLDVWCRELALDQAWRWSDEALLEGVYRLQRMGHPFAAEAAGFYENVMGSRRNVRRKNTEDASVQPGTLSVQRPALEKPGFHESKSPDLKTKIPEEEIPRPAGGSTLQRWDLDQKINEKSGISSLSGGGPERPERPRALEGVRRETERDAARPALAKAAARPLAATETRPQRHPATPAPREEKTLVEGLPGFLALCQTPMPTQYVTREQAARKAWTKAMADEALRMIAALEDEGVKSPRGS
jgi:hypothetical protein